MTVCYAPCQCSACAADRQNRLRLARSQADRIMASIAQALLTKGPVITVDTQIFTSEPYT